MCTLQLLFCAMCCEPYHAYCLNTTPQLNKMWICERCELCCECNSPTLHHEDVMRCHKCASPYHKHCLTIKPSQRPWVNKLIHIPYQIQKYLHS